MCPKCQSQMTTFDRMGIHLEQCTHCRGIFLDHGELEQILRAEQRHYGAPAAPPAYGGGRPHADSPRGYRGRSDSPGPFHGGHHDSPRPYRGGYSDSPRPYRRRKSFLENLFD
ncbi:zf-TFIIB domain-containing protein [Nocardiopsis sediminis]|uniref:Zf-TFIIB domain-containing protein n=1 Tax=Nocardiopsis sediminis TaxID=1778267 RepID=A0ABV8FT36_9ACTN